MTQHSFGRAAFYVVILALLIHIAIGSQSLQALDRLFIPDDTFYTLTIARSLAHGLGPTTDGSILTSGFQPLIAFILVPVFWLFNDIDSPIYAAIALSALFGVLNTGLVGLIVRNVTRSYGSAVLAMLFAASAPVLLKNNFNGLETSIASFFALLTVYLMGRVQTGSATIKLVGIGCSAGLALLARVDNCFVIALVGLWGLHKLNVKATGILVISALAVVSPWWIYTYQLFGTFVPESGAAVKQIVGFHQELHLTLVSALNGSMIALAELASGDRAWQRVVYPLALGIASFFPLIGAYRKKMLDEASILSLASLALFLFYTFYLPAFWFFERYFHFLYLSLIICVSVTLNTLPNKVYFNSTSPRKISAMVAVIFIAVNLLQLASLRTSHEDVIYTGNKGAKGYGEIARQIIAMIPDGATIAAMQSGALGYYSARGIRVLNLDGVVNNSAYLAIKEKRLNEYLAATSTDYFADWDFNTYMLLRHSGGNKHKMTLIPLGKFKPQGSDQFTLYRVNSVEVP